MTNEEELSIARAIFWAQSIEDRTFAVCMRYFRAVKACGLFHTDTYAIALHCPEHLHDTLEAQFRLEGLM